MNGYPCGYYGGPVKQCSCTSAIITRYQKRIFSPPLERIEAAHLAEAVQYRPRQVA